MDRTQDILRIIAEVSGKEIQHVGREMELVANLGLDSAKSFELLVKLEDCLGIEIEEEDAAGLNTVADILDFVVGDGG